MRHLILGRAGIYNRSVELEYPAVNPVSCNPGLPEKIPSLISDCELNDLAFYLKKYGTFSLSKFVGEISILGTCSSCLLELSDEIYLHMDEQNCNDDSFWIESSMFFADLLGTRDLYLGLAVLRWRRHALDRKT